METIVVKNLKETKELADKFAKLLVGGERIILNGDLGAGKTTFTKYVLESLGVDDTVTSPTFTIMREYKTKRFNIYHFDMYRISSGVEALEFGLDEYLYSQDRNIVFIEWAENIKDILEGNFITINITIEDDDKRKFEICR